MSAGELLRKERDKNIEFAKEFNEHARKGTIVPVATTCRLLENVIVLFFVKNIFFIGKQNNFEKEKLLLIE